MHSQILVGYFICIFTVQSIDSNERNKESTKTTTIIHNGQKVNIYEIPFSYTEKNGIPVEKLAAVRQSPNKYPEHRVKSQQHNSINSYYESNPFSDSPVYPARLVSIQKEHLPQPMLTYSEPAYLRPVYFTQEEVFPHSMKKSEKLIALSPKNGRSIDNFEYKRRISTPQGLFENGKNSFGDDSNLRYVKVSEPLETVNFGDPEPVKYQSARQTVHPLLVHTTKRLKSIPAHYFEPQYFSNPIVPQHQHYLPKVFTLPQQNAFYAKSIESGKPKRIETEVRQVIVEEEPVEYKEENFESGNDDRAFEKAYKNAAYGFPAYEQDRGQEYPDDNQSGENYDSVEESEEEDKAYNKNHKSEKYKKLSNNPEYPIEVDYSELSNIPTFKRNTQRQISTAQNARPIFQLGYEPTLNL